MARTNTAEPLAARLRLVMETHAAKVMERPGVSGAGVAWRRGCLRFVVQTDSTDKVEALLATLPAQVEGFPVSVEVEALSTAAEDEGPSRSPRRGWNIRTLWARRARRVR